VRICELGAAAILCVGMGLGAVANPVVQRVDINHAGLDELLKVPGLGRVWAVRIVRYRPYRTKEDLLDKGVVTSAVYDRIKDLVVAHRDKASIKQVLRLR
jgi:predicted DNA-binding helix-hairpin-helix protein